GLLFYSLSHIINLLQGMTGSWRRTINCLYKSNNTPHNQKLPVQKEASHLLTMDDLPLCYTQINLCLQ
ncbi:MAG: hypothetical protein AB7E34_10200, partial [Acidaminococcaceae bacterium]